MNGAGLPEESRGVMPEEYLKNKKKSLTEYTLSAGALLVFLLPIFGMLI